MITTQKIWNIQEKIVNRVYNQVKNGKQKEGLPDACEACGQFFNILDRTQRGLHGTSSALRIFAMSTSQDVKDSIPKIINYLANHGDIESGSDGTVQIDDRNRRDELNVIKIGETLFSLSHVKGETDSAELVKKLANQLTDNMVEGKGWPYFLQSGSSTPELLPTTFAALGLFSSSSKDLRKTYDYLFTEIESKVKQDKLDLTTYSILVFCLYVITFHYPPNMTDNAAAKKLKNIYNKLWDNDCCIFNEDIEQNIEYWHKDNHYYVRIPWQLYMIALSAKFCSWNFAKENTQNRLNNIYQSCNENDGFRYPYSGPYLSVRTHAIIYETLKVASENFKDKFIYWAFNYVDRIRTFLSKRVFRVLISVSSLLLATWIIYRSFKDNALDLKNLVPELLGPILVWLILLGKRK